MFTKKIVVGIGLAAGCVAVFYLGGCGSVDSVPSNAGVRQGAGPGVPNPAGYDRNPSLGDVTSPDSPIPPSAAVQQILLRHFQYLEDLKSRRADAGPQDEEQRAQRGEALNRILSEPDPETRRILITWLKPVVEPDPEAMQILKELQENDNPPNTEAEPSDGLTGFPGQDASAGETGD
jgi:hypothetical protein